MGHNQVAGSRGGEPRMQGGFSGKGDERRVKVKQPKQKVKGPAPQVAAALAPERTFFEGPPCARGRRATTRDPPGATDTLKKSDSD